MSAYRELPGRDLSSRQFARETFFFVGAGQIISADVHSCQYHLIVIINKKQARVAAAVSRSDIGYIGLEVENRLELVSLALPAFADGENADDQVGISGGMQLLFIDPARGPVVADPAFP